MFFLGGRGRGDWYLSVMYRAHDLPSSKLEDLQPFHLCPRTVTRFLPPLSESGYERTPPPNRNLTAAEIYRSHLVMWCQQGCFLLFSIYTACHSTLLRTCRCYIIHGESSDMERENARAVRLTSCTLWPWIFTTSILASAVLNIAPMPLAQSVYFSSTVLIFCLELISPLAAALNRTA